MINEHAAAATVSNIIRKYATLGAKCAVGNINGAAATDRFVPCKNAIARAKSARLDINRAAVVDL